jgi:hypothetical protein
MLFTMTIPPPPLALVLALSVLVFLAVRRFKIHNKQAVSWNPVRDRKEKQHDLAGGSVAAGNERGWPAIEPLTGFDLNSAEPDVFRPWKKVYNITMGMSKLMSSKLRFTPLVFPRLLLHEAAVTR